MVLLSSVAALKNGAGCTRAARVRRGSLDGAASTVCLALYLNFTMKYRVLVAPAPGARWITVTG